MTIKALMTGPALILVVVYLLSACSTSLPDKQIIVVDDYDMAYAIKGGGSPVVVLESVLGAEMSNWLKVFPEVANFSRVFAYNHRGVAGITTTIRVRSCFLLL